jgi:PAS domain S-box-containing protein
MRYSVRAHSTRHNAQEPDVEPPLESPAEEITRLRDALNELRGAMAPALWAGGETPRIVDASLERLYDIADEVEQRGAGHARALAAANEALRKSQRESRLVVDSIPGLVALLSAAGEVEFVNRQILEYTGQTLEELKQWGTNGTVHPDDLPHVAEVFTQSIGSGSPYEIVQRLRQSDGRYRWFQNNGFPLRDPDGHIVRWCVLLTDIDERKRVEDALRESERESRLIVDSIPGIIATFTPFGEVEFVNRPALAYFGKTFEELKNWESGGATHPEDLPRVVALFTQAITSGETPVGESFVWECRTRRFDGVYRWFQSRLFPLRNANGQIIRWYNLLIDIDERKRAEEALRSSERELKLIIDTIPALAWSARPDGSAEFFNQHYLDFVGLSAEQASGWGWTTAVHPDDLNGLAATWQRMMASERAGEAEARLRRHDGEYRSFLFRADPLRDESGRVVRWYGVNIDIEDRKRMEEALRSSEAFLLDVQRLTRVGGWRYDPVKDVVANSAEIHRAYAVQPDDDVSHGSFWFDRIHPDDRQRVQAEFGRCMREKADYRAAYRIVWPDGSIRYHHAIGHPVTDGAGELVEFVGAAIDMTEEWRATTELERASDALRELQAKMSRAAQVATVGELAASIAHEVNQPLSGIITNVNTCLRLLAADPPNLDAARETVRRTLRDGNRAAEVISRVRALFRKRDFAVEWLDLNEVTREVLTLSSSDLQKNRVTLHAELLHELPTITGDRIQLQQVILNLLRNASDAMVDVGDRPRHVLVRTELDGADHVRLSVRDAGLGIDPESTNRIFEAFYTTKSDGMGIGLSISRSIVERHHGRLWAEPNDGPGATFVLSIPCHARGAAMATASD